MLCLLYALTVLAAPYTKDSIVSETSMTEAGAKAAENWGVDSHELTYGDCTYSAKSVPHKYCSSDRVGLGNTNNEHNCRTKCMEYASNNNYADKFCCMYKWTGDDSDQYKCQIGESGDNSLTKDDNLDWWSAKFTGKTC